MRFDLQLLDFVECDKDSEKLAISASDKDLTWNEFKIEVEKLKIELSQYKLPKGHPVVIYGHKEAKFIVSMTACMSLGLPYIPVDTIYPKERLNKIVNIVGSAVVISTIEDKIEINANNLNTNYHLDDPIIYIIFTSGSTGEPKGVQITNKTNQAHFLNNALIGARVAPTLKSTTQTSTNLSITKEISNLI